MKRIPGCECRLGIKVAVGQPDIHEQGQIRRYRLRERCQVEIGKQELDQTAGADRVEELRVARDVTGLQRGR